jgi:succinyl-diaminopimelate desuccinylase
VVFTEQLQAVGVEGGVSGNVVPDEATVTLNHRVAPDRDVAAATTWLTSFVAPYLDDGDAVEVTDAAEPGAPSLDHPALARLVTLSGVAPKGKLGYTDVSMLASIGVPATNFGAGDPELAHHAGEFVTATDLERCFEVLTALLDVAAE